ncbi:MAG TPA: hypothetical protein ENJ82_04370 [Bacteroidetes bacterium]|nr:hypothetical protein [Bacteroidota bacterium]
MERKKYLTAFLLLFSFQTFLLAQSIQYSAFPQHLQLYPRDASDSATVPISGLVTTPGQDSILLTVYQNNLYWQRQAHKLIYSKGQAFFDFETRIPAETIEFKFEIALASKGITRTHTTADSIVCGDIYLVSGQSNAIPQGNAPYGYRNEYCRSFGKITIHASYDPADTLWGLATGMGWSPGNFGVGTWALDLMRIIKDDKGIPVAILNGAVNGSNIEFNQPNPLDSLDLSTTYGRLLYRAQKSNIAQHAKAFIWIQGENGKSILNYAANFDTLYRAWHINFPNLQTIYVFQIGMNQCGIKNKHILREIQRKFGDQYTDVEVLPCNGLPGFQGCHWWQPGYFKLAGWLYGILVQDFYGDSLDIDAFPPRIKKAVYTSLTRDEIALTFEDQQHIIWDSIHVLFRDTFFLRNYIYFDDSLTTVQKGYTSNDTLFLSLSSTSQAKHLTYLPDYSYKNLSYPYLGPFIKSLHGITALTFHDFPIDLPPEHESKGSNK